MFILSLHCRFYLNKLNLNWIELFNVIYFLNVFKFIIFYLNNINIIKFIFIIIYIIFILHWVCEFKTEVHLCTSPSQGALSQLELAWLYLSMQKQCCGHKHESHVRASSSHWSSSQLYTLAKRIWRVSGESCPRWDWASATRYTLAKSLQFWRATQGDTQDPLARAHRPLKKWDLNEAKHEHQGHTRGSKARRVFPSTLSLSPCLGFPWRECTAGIMWAASQLVKIKRIFVPPFDHKDLDP